MLENIKKLEYRCTTTNLTLFNGAIDVLKIALPNSVSVLTNFVIRKLAKKQNKKIHDISGATHDPHHSAR